MRTKAATQEYRSLLLVVIASIGWACGSTPTSPWPPTGPPSAPAGPAGIPIRVFGVVTNDQGAPLAGASVLLTYQPDLTSTQGANTTAGADGRFELQLDAVQPGNVNALIRATAGDAYNPSEHFVRVAASAEQNIRLRPVRTITVGQAITVRFDSDSSVCASLGVEGLCEWVRIQYPSTFTYQVRVTATGGAVPTLRAIVPLAFFGFYEPNQTVVGQGSVTIQTGDDEYAERYRPRTADVAISIPAGMAPQQYEVTVSTADGR